MMLKERVGRLLWELGQMILPASRRQVLSAPQMIVRTERPHESELSRLSAADGWPAAEAVDGRHITAEAYHYYLLRFTYEVPKEQDGETLMFELRTGDRHAWTRDTPFERSAGWDGSNPQFLAVVNGKIHAGMDEHHEMFVLEDQAEAGDRYEILLMHYAGHAPGDFPVEAYVTPLEREVKDYFYDLKMPYDVVMLLSEINQDHVNVIQALNNSLNLVDLREPGSEAFKKSLKRASEDVKKNLYKRYADPKKLPVLKTVGHTHIDIAWLWPLSMTEDKAVRSFATVLELMRVYPEYIFMSSQPQLYRWIQMYAPSMFEEIKKRVAEGRWEVEGGMWIEADCNVSSGEALARQFLYGKRYFRENFGKDNKILWLPDVFGYSAALPQILKLSEIDYFMTTKISWNETNQLPVDTFMWEGIDGSRTLSHFSPPVNYHALADFFPNVRKGFTTYNSTITASQVLGSWQRYQQKDLNKEALMLVGHGDGGGGTTMEMMENARRFEQGLPGAPRTEWSTARGFFEKLKKDVEGKRELPTWKGELYLEFHRGTYTTMARNKRWNRRAEFAFQGVEKLRTATEAMLGLPYPAEGIHEGWLLLLKNQFHDILPGSSIREVYDDSEREYSDMFVYTGEVETHAVRALRAAVGAEPDDVLLVNHQSFTRSEALELDAPDDGNWALVPVDETKIETPVPGQRLENGKLLVMTPDVPATGYRLCRWMRVEDAGDAPEEGETGKKSRGEMTLENASLRLVFNKDGRLTSFYDKRVDREILQHGEVGNDLVTFEDKPIHFDGWDIADYYREKSWKVPGASSMRLLDDGPLRQTLELNFEGEGYAIRELVHLYGESGRVDLAFDVDWHVTHQLLKLMFPLDIVGYEATYEIQYGSVTRHMHENTSWDRARFEVVNHKWLDIHENNYGVAILNDSKYGSSLHDGVVGLTLLKSSTWPNPVADREHHHFEYSLRPHSGDWRYHDIVREAYAFNDALVVDTGSDAPLAGLPVTKPALMDDARARRTLAGMGEAAGDAKPEDVTSGSALPPAMSFVGTPNKNVIIEAMKRADRGDGVVIRLYEAFGRRDRVEVNLGIPCSKVTEVNILEHPADRAMQARTDLTVEGNTLHFDLRPYEIKSFLLETGD